MSRQMDWGIDGPINKLADRWTDEQMDGWISGWVNGWMDRHFYTWLSVCIPFMSKADFSPSSDVCACVRACVHMESTPLLFLCACAIMCVKQLCSADRLSWRYMPQTARWYLFRRADLIPAWTISYCRLHVVLSCEIQQICETALAFGPGLMHIH